MAEEARPSQAMPLADLVEEHAPALMVAAGAPRLRADDDVARALVSIWRSGPPYPAEVERARKRLSDRPRGESSPAGGTSATDDGPDPTRIDRIHRLAQTYRIAGRRRRRAVSIAAVVVVIALAVILVPRVPPPRAAPPPASSTGTVTPTRTPVPAPSTADPSTPTSAGNTALTCRSQSCLPDRASGWAPQVVAAASEHLDVDSAFSESGIIAATDLASDRTGRLLRVTVTAPTTGATVDVWTAEDVDQLPPCGAVVQTDCQLMVARDGFRIAVARTDDVIEARFGTGDSTVQILMRNAGRPIAVEVNRVFDFLVDQRVQLPT